MTDPLRLLLLADTHVPKRARDLPAEVWTAVDAADVVVHAGDWVDVALLDRLGGLGGSRWRTTAPSCPPATSAVMYVQCG